ncbi:MAG: enoyl-CoA hydratase/isomerase family protein [Desulfuromusa sp.]|nr:enoyl-CoA hydratase/isomerase family protein [Desulfuromusa sp.]
MDISRLNVDRGLFWGETSGEVLILSFRSRLLAHVSDLGVKGVLLDYLDLVACRDDVKVVVIKQAVTKMRSTDYITFYKSMIGSDFDQLLLERMYNAVGQFILKIANLSKLVVHADSGDVIPLFMNIGLASDYRIVADNTVFRNPNIELGVVPKGGSVFFLSKMLGTGIASRVLLSGEDIDAKTASQLGIVDNVVPLDELDHTALEKARSLTRISTGYAAGIKKLLNYDIKELACFLEFENDLLRRLVRSCDLHNFGRLDANL